VTIRVVIADDQSLVRAGLRTILEAEPDIRVVGECGDGEAAIALVRDLVPDLVLMDIRMPGLDGLSATREIAGHGPDAVRVVILTTFDHDEYVYEALRAGASGFLVKDLRDDELTAGVRAVAHGDTLLASSVTRRLIEAYTRRRPQGQAHPGSEHLTSREREVWHLVARGLSNVEIAAHLFISEATAKTHVSRLLAKLSARDRVHLVVYAYESAEI
jgi:DNA-binding NarL/FixJ family response regulator